MAGHISSHFAVTSCDGVDITVYSIEAAKRHAKELKKDFDIACSIYEITGDIAGPSVDDAVNAMEEAIRDRINVHTITAKQKAAIEKAHNVVIVKR